jgi:hypothetical protein
MKNTKIVIILAALLCFAGIAQAKGHSKSHGKTSKPIATKIAPNPAVPHHWNFQKKTTP